MDDDSNTKIITLTTDWGLCDSFASYFRYRINAAYNKVKFIEVTHQLPPYNLFDAAFTVNTFIAKYPAETIHVFGFGDSSEKHPIVIASANR